MMSGKSAVISQLQLKGRDRIKIQVNKSSKFFLLE